MSGLTELYGFDWNGMLLEITYEPVWMPAHIAGEDIAHLKVRSIYPTDVPLPFAKHGCFSSTVLASTVAAASGPVNYVDVMLTVDGDAPAGQERCTLSEEGTHRSVGVTVSVIEVAKNRLTQSGEGTIDDHHGDTSSRERGQSDCP